MKYAIGLQGVGECLIYDVISIIIDYINVLMRRENRVVSKNNLVQKIKDKEMDRKDFLKYSGIALLTLVGLKGVISLLSNSIDKIDKPTNDQSKTSGFGSGRYGV